MKTQNPLTSKAAPSRQWKAWALGLSLLLILGIDQWSKFLAVEYLRGRPSLHFLGGMVRLLYAENRGAWGSLGSDWPEFFRLSLLVVFPIIILCALMGHILYSRSLSRPEVLGLSLIAAGGWGNMLDRLRLGYVVDMFWVGIPGNFFQTNIFNIADAVIMAGLFLLVFVHLGEMRLKRKNQVKSQLDA